MSEIPHQKREISNGEAVLGFFILIGIIFFIIGWEIAGAIVIGVPIFIVLVAFFSEWDFISFRYLRR